MSDTRKKKNFPVDSRLRQSERDILLSKTDIQDSEVEKVTAIHVSNCQIECVRPLCNQNQSLSSVCINKL